MAFRLSPHEPLSLGAARACIEQIARARAALRSAPASTGAFDARRRIKKARAALRLARPALANADWRRDDQALRAVAQALAPVREAQAHAESLDGLIAFYGEALGAQPFAAARRSLAADAARAARMLREADVFAQADAALGVAAHRIGTRAPEPMDRTVGIVAVRRAYAIGRRDMDRAQETGAAPAFHDWRKRVKRLRFSMRFLELDPHGDGREGLRRLARALGDDHDLYHLRAAAQAGPESFGGEGAVAALGALAAQRMAALRAEALEVGASLYADKPKAFFARLGDPALAA